MRDLFKWLAFAFLSAVSCGAAAQAPTRVAPPEWRVFAPNIDGRGFRTCIEAREWALAVVAANAAPNTITDLPADMGCQPNVPNTSFNYRTSDMQPTTPSRTMGMQAMCGNQANNTSISAERGLFCHPGVIHVARAVGYCETCTVGNPVGPGLGNKIEVERDYLGAGPFPLRFERVFNSAHGGRTNQARLGTNWTHTYYRRLHLGGPDASTVNMATVFRPDGRSWNFNLSGGVFVTEADVPERLEKLVNGWRYTNQDDEVELYDAQGLLQSITSRAGLTHTVGYFASGPHAGLMEKVTDPFGRTLSFEYGTARNAITAVIDPAGGRFEFSYFQTTGMEVLIGVKYPDNTTRTYHRENPNNGTLLTGITDENGVRYLGIDYVDVSIGAPKPQATRNADGLLNANRTEIAYTSPVFFSGFTDVTQYVDYPSSSATRRYNYTNVLGVPRLTSITGPACPSCGPAAQTFDANGNVATRTDWNGNRTNFGYNLTRNLETSRTEALTSGGASTPQTRTITTQYHSTFQHRRGDV